MGFRAALRLSLSSPIRFDHRSCVFCSAPLTNISGFETSRFYSWFLDLAFNHGLLKELAERSASAMTERRHSSRNRILSDAIGSGLNFVGFLLLRPSLFENFPPFTSILVRDTTHPPFPGVQSIRLTIARSGREVHYSRDQGCSGRLLPRPNTALGHGQR